MISVHGTALKEVKVRGGQMIMIWSKSIIVVNLPNSGNGQWTGTLIRNIVIKNADFDLYADSLDVPMIDN